MTPILCFDLETTSQYPDTCRACQVAAVAILPKHDSDELNINSWADEICDPGLESSDGATAIHGIGPEQWAGKRTDVEALTELYNSIEDARADDGSLPLVIAGHNVLWYDLPVMYRIAERAPIFGLQVIDTMVCAQRIYPMAPSHRLTTNPAEPDKKGLINWLFGDDAVSGAHSAVGDAHMVYRLVAHFMEGLQKTPEELAAWCATPRILKTCHFGKYKGRLWGKPPPGREKEYVPYPMVKWIVQNFNAAPDMEATIYKHWKLRFRYHYKRSKVNAV